MPTESSPRDPERRIARLESTVAERADIETALKLSEERYRSLFDQFPLSIFVWTHVDGEFRLVDFNRQAKSETEGRVADFLGMSATEIYHGSNEHVRAALAECHRSGQSIRRTILYTTRGTPSEAWLDCTWVCIRPDTVMFITENIDERKRTEAALRENEEQYRLLHETAGVGIGYWDRAGTLLSINQKALEFMGGTQDDFLGRTATDIFGPDIGPETMRRIRQAAEAAHPVTYEDDILLPVGIRSLMSTYNPVTNPEGLILGVQIISADITQRKQAEQERSDLQRQLAQAQKMEAVGNLAGGIAHDFNNLLASIIGFTEMALESADRNPNQAASLQQVLRAGMRARDLVKQILTQARPSDEERRPVRPAAVVGEVLDFMRSSLPASIEIHRALASEAVVLADTTQLHQVVMNLCTNSAHAMRDEGGVLEVSLHDEPVGDRKNGSGQAESGAPGIVLKVRDSGQGVPAELLDSIFDPYFTTKGPGEGSGLGLAVVKSIVESFGGRISVASLQGAGTVVSVWLPATDGPVPELENSESTIPTGTERVLVVDDEPVVADVMERTLARLGYDVTATTRSLDALALFEAHPYDFDLILSDTTMPQMSGDALAVEMMRIRADIPVILCTGFSSRVDEQSAKALGIRALAAKPLVREELAQIVRRVLDSRTGVEPGSG